MVYIEWRDSLRSSIGWDDLPTEANIGEVKTLGWAHIVGQEAIVVVPHLCNQTANSIHGYGGMSIPASAIRKITHVNADVPRSSSSSKIQPRKEPVGSSRKTAKRRTVQRPDHRDPYRPLGIASVLSPASHGNLPSPEPKRLDGGDSPDSKGGS